MEVPIIFPSHVASSHRFIVNDVNCTIARYQTKHASRDTKKRLHLDDIGENAIHCGSASMSSLDFQSTGTTAILTTSALSENSHVLSVALSSNTPDSPVIVQLDLVSEMTEYGNTVKVKASVEARYGQECIRLILVADNAVVLSIRLWPSNLAPFDLQQGSNCVEVLDVRDLLNPDPAKKEAISGSLIHKAMVAFFSPTSMVLALSPLLMSVDVEARACEVWLESQCLEDMRARESTIGSVLSTVSDLILGRLDDGALVDMAPTAAVCVSSTGNPLLDPTFVFTLHSDGQINRWRVSDDSLRPIDVYPITIEMPDSRDWSDIHNSVYLTARLYGPVYVLAVHVQTCSRASLDSDANLELGPLSHLFVVYGGKDNNSQNGEALEMALPNGALGLVDMEFSPKSDTCSLTAMFRSVTSDQYAAPMIMIALYPPSVVSIINSQPEIAPLEYFLDVVAQNERARIASLIFNDELQGTATTSNLSLDDEIHEMDCRFMKYLFLPGFPRGSGTVTAPKDFHVRNAIQKIIYGRTRHFQEDGADMSIQLETLRAVQKWRIRETQQFRSSTPQKTSEADSNSIAEQDTTKSAAISAYDSYVDSVIDDKEGNDETEESDGDVDQIERERVLQLEMHSCRWRHLLLAIWEEEQSLRWPLGLFLLADSNVGEAMLVRSGFTSILAGYGSGSSDNALTQLDLAALKLIQALESHGNSGNRLFATEQRIWNNIAKAQFDETTLSDFREECSRVVDFAFDSARGAVFSISEQRELGHALGTIPVEDYFALLQDMPQGKELPGISLINTSQGGAAREEVTTRNIIANNQVIQAVCALFVRCIDSSRRLLLARYLLISYLVRSSEVSTVAFFTYQRVLAVMWAGSQKVPIPTAFSRLSSVEELSDQHFEKHFSFGDRSSSIPAELKMTTCIRSLLISYLQSGHTIDETSPIRFVLSLCQSVFHASMQSTVPKPFDFLSPKLQLVLPELGALPPSPSPAAATDYPRLALRLISPLVGLGSARVVPNVAAARKETLAACLLVESHSQLLETTKTKMRNKACELLASNPVESGNLSDTKDAFGILLKPGATQRLSDVDLKSLARTLQLFIYGAELEIRSEINRLLELETANRLFGCLLAGRGEMTLDVEEAVKCVSPRLLHLSNTMHRVEILEHHVGRSKGSTDFILHIISSAIRELHDLFPPEILDCMPENLSLYSSWFHTAVSSKEWNQAYDACLNIPLVELKVSFFKSLVNTMVDAGALQELTNRSSTLAPPTSTRPTAENVDFCSIAADALSEACCHDLHVVKVNAVSDAPLAAPDYEGSLYSMYASRGQWRKAAQSLDLRYVNGMCTLGNGPDGQSKGSEAVSIREKLIVEDLVLSSVGTANVASLVEETAEQYIVSGASDQFPSIHIEALSDSEYGAKSAKRGRQPGLNPVTQEPASLDQIGQFMTSADLCGRSTWSLGLRKLCLDSSASFDGKTTMMFNNGSASADKNALEELSGCGYYFSCLLVELAMSKTGSFGGRFDKAFHNLLFHQLFETLVPLSTNDNIRALKVRPSLSQMTRFLDYFSSTPGSAPCIVGCHFKSQTTGIQTCLHAMSAELVQKLTGLHTSAEHPAALILANCILESNNRISQIPYCVERLMMVGSSSVESKRCGGAFAKQCGVGISIAFLGDASALLSLYLQQGMLVEACHVLGVTLRAIQGRIEGDREGKLQSPIPEKVKSEFVPYKKIDILWNLIDCALGKSNGDDRTRKLQSGQELLIHALAKHLLVIKGNEVGSRSAKVVVRASLQS